MLVISNHTKFHLLALTVQCLSAFQPNDTQKDGTNSDLLFYIIQKYYLQMLHRSILCLGVLLCTIKPREITNTSLFCCNGSHYLLTSIAGEPTFWLAHIDRHPLQPSFTYPIGWVLRSFPLHFLVFLIGQIRFIPPTESTQFFLGIHYSFCIHDTLSPKRWKPHVLR